MQNGGPDPTDVCLLSVLLRSRHFSPNLKSFLWFLLLLLLLTGLTYGKQGWKRGKLDRARVWQSWG